MSEQDINSPAPRRKRKIDFNSINSQHEELIQKSRRKKNRTLMSVVGISFLVHVIALLIFGSYTIYKYVQAEDDNLAAPPPMNQIDPVQVEYKVKMKNLSESQSSRPKAKVLTVQQVSDISTPNVDFQIDPSISKVNLATNNNNMGSGLGRALGGGGIGFGVSAVDFFGIKSEGEKIVFVIDTSGSMLAPNRGDLIGFKRVKEEVVKMINKLSPGTLFNVFMFDSRLDVFEQQLIPATDSNKERVAQWIQPYWDYTGTQITGRRGTSQNNFKPDMPGWLAKGGGTRLDLALMAAFQQNADTVFVLTDGAPNIGRELNEEEKAMLAKSIAEWEKRGPPTEKEREEYQRKVKEHNEKRRAAAEDRRKKGMPPQVAGVGGPPQPPWAKPSLDRSYTRKEIVDYLSAQARRIYGERGGKLPSVNIVGYSVSTNDASFLNEVRRQYPRSRYRDIGSIVTMREVEEMYKAEQEANQDKK